MVRGPHGRGLGAEIRSQHHIRAKELTVGHVASAAGNRRRHKDVVDPAIRRHGARCPEVVVVPRVAGALGARCLPRVVEDEVCVLRRRSSLAWSIVPSASDSLADNNRNQASCCLAKTTKLLLALHQFGQLRLIAGHGTVLNTAADK